MAFETTLTLALIGLVCVAFLALHLALRRIPWTEADPVEGFRWPVWNWYALVVGIGLIGGLVANLYWNARTPDHNPNPMEIHRTSGRDKGAKSELLSPMDRILVSGRLGPEIASTATPPDPLASPTGTATPIATATPPIPDPFVSPAPTATPVTTTTATPEPTVSPLRE
jgi:hypothetical protein